MLRSKIFSCTCAHTWCYGIKKILHEFGHGVWLDLFLCSCPFVLALQSSNKNRDVKTDQTFKYIANVEWYKIVMTTIHLSVEIFTSMCHPVGMSARANKGPKRRCSICWSTKFCHQWKIPPSNLVLSEPGTKIVEGVSFLRTCMPIMENRWQGIRQCVL